MKKSKTLELPILNDVVIPGKDVEEQDEFPSILNELEIKALQKQIDKIVKRQLEATLNKAINEASNDIKKHLDKVLPNLIKTAKKRS
ncbi:hypothetical protein QUF74_05340 [Candidatus Halobeggiatoa sp. HSG11]|nr:hypothetical protein [Candidatus Halobeggiatoa sp. HSG11]